VARAQVRRTPLLEKSEIDSIRHSLILSQASVFVSAGTTRPISMKDGPSQFMAVLSTIQLRSSSPFVGN
jgi:hypothetical protein